MNYITDSDIDKITGETGKSLSQEPKIELIIPVESENDNQPFECGINGYFFRIRRGEKVSVPRSIAELIASKAQVTFVSNEQTKAFKNKGKKLDA